MMQRSWPGSALFRRQTAEKIDSATSLSRGGRLLGVAVVMVVAMAWTHPVRAADIYAGKQVVVIAGTEPGGGYDFYARTLARHLPKHIPGNPSAIVQNMPGAGGIRGANFLYNVAAKDGLTIGQIHNGLPFAQL